MSDIAARAQLRVQAKMIHAAARRPACIIVAACCLPGPLLCQAQGPVCDGIALLQVEAVVDSRGGQPAVGAAASNGELAGSAQLATVAQLDAVPAAEARAGSGCELGRDLLIASLDQPEMPGEFVEDDGSWAPLPTRRSLFIKTAILDEPQLKRQSLPERHLTTGGRISQILPVVAVMALSFDKMRQAYRRNVNSHAAVNVIEVLAALTLYCVSGPAVILLNKHIMRNEPQVPLPDSSCQLGERFPHDRDPRRCSIWVEDARGQEPPLG
ncbi:unnamed protein product [Prorocentrum cordatum]|uniref:Uncharacterized protein n=1 Tax=Prorocentrum cordatum TaxID=2364126 RepID=A0ABN9WBX7_9DINO|nr:unnamed protein product [Polarella glacialis]